MELEEHAGVVEREGRAIAYLDRGPRHGRPVVYLHGMPGCGLEQRLIPDAALSRAGVRLISIDRPGWGSTAPVDGGNRIARSADVVVVADELRLDRFALMAVSAGGSYALTAAVTAGDRVERLVLVSAQMPYDDEDAIEGLLPDQRALLPILRAGRTPELVAGIEDYRQTMLADPLSLFAAASATLSEPERAFLAQERNAALFAEDISHGLRRSADGLLADLLLWPVALEVDPADVVCPVVALHGTTDDWEPLPNLRRHLDRIPDTELLLIDGRNHMGPLLHPDVMLACTR